MKTDNKRQIIKMVGINIKNVIGRILKARDGSKKAL